MELKMKDINGNEVIRNLPITKSLYLVKYLKSLMTFPF